MLCRQTTKQSLGRSSGLTGEVEGMGVEGAYITPVNQQGHS